MSDAFVVPRLGRQNDHTTKMSLKYENSGIAESCLLTGFRTTEVGRDDTGFCCSRLDHTRHWSRISLQCIARRRFFSSKFKEIDSDVILIKLITGDLVKKKKWSNGSSKSLKDFIHKGTVSTSSLDQLPSHCSRNDDLKLPTSVIKFADVTDHPFAICWSGSRRKRSFKMEANMRRPYSAVFRALYRMPNP